MALLLHDNNDGSSSFSPSASPLNDGSPPAWTLPPHRRPSSSPGTQPGNHDFWVKSAPSVYEPGRDQLGNGFMQFYGQDVAASALNAATPYDFSVDPNVDLGSHSANAENLPVADNFFYYNQIGNVGFM